MEHWFSLALFEPAAPSTTGEHLDDADAVSDGYVQRLAFETSQSRLHADLGSDSMQLSSGFCSL